MKTAIICFSFTGWNTASRLAEQLELQGNLVEIAGKSRYLPDSISESVGEWTKKQFFEAEAIIFVGACGIAVRSIAPYVTGKKQDPAVLVVDECGNYVISLLSGHLGGANELTAQAAACIQAVPVITTATDLHQRFAVDVFAKKNQCEILGMKEAKEVSAALLAGKKVGFYSEYPWKGTLPKGLLHCNREGFPIKNGEVLTNGKKPEIGVAVTIHPACRPFFYTTQVVPKTLVVGLGCKKGKEEEGICQAVEDTLKELEVYRESLKCFASIDLKKQEPGICALAEKWKVPFVTFSKEELKKVQGDFTPSLFVKQITGVDNVCERSAVLAGTPGHLQQRKKGRNGVTTAVSEIDWRIRFE